jgi:hypothetical protein
MIHHAERGTYAEARIPLWRRITALFSLSALVVVIGILLAAVIGVSVLLMLFLVERAIAG